jgi:[ribosomal protein S5]-alanine N-acetyltransferase
LIRGLKTNLRAVERSDARLVWRLLNEPAVQDGWGMPGTPVSIHRVEQDIEQWLEHERSAGRPSGLVLETLDGDPIGLAIILVDGYSGASATVSFAIDPGWQDQGYGRDALSALIDALFDEWRLHRVEVACEAGNERAAHLYESLGFVHEGTRRGATFLSGEFQDQRIYGLLATDPRPEPA